MELFDPYFQAGSALGLPLSGAKLAFYRAGTTSLVTVYQDAAGTTPHTNPVTADASGLFPPIYLNTIYPLKTILKTALGVTIQTVQRINPAPVGVDAGMYVVGTLADLTAITPSTEFDEGQVLDDADPANNGYYYRDGAAWVKGRGFADSFADMTVTGGTDNNIEAALDLAIDESDIVAFRLIPPGTNTGPMTINGIPLLDFAGNELAAGYVQEGAPVLFSLDENGDYRLFLDHRFQVLSDQTEADAASAEAARIAAEAARDLAAGYVNDIVSEKEVPITATRDGMEALPFPAGMNSLETRGYAAMDDNGGAKYVRVATEPTHDLKVRSVDRYLPDGSVDATNGGWWEISVPWLFGEMAGVVADGTTDDKPAIDRAFRYIEAMGGGAIMLPPRTMRMATGGVGWCNGLKLGGIPGVTKFKLDPGINAEMFTNWDQVADIPIDDLSLEGIIFDANASDTAPYAASAATVNGYRRLRIKDCIFENATGYGLGLQAKPVGSTISGPQDECWLEGLTFRNNGHNGTGGDQHDGLDMKSANKLWAKNCIAYGNGDKGLDFRGQFVQVEDCIAYDNGTFGISIQFGPVSTGGGPIHCSLRGLETYNNGARGVQIAMDDVDPGEESSVVVLDDVKSYGNALDGVIIYDPFSVGKLDLTATNIHCWANGNHGFNNSSPGSKVSLIGGSFSKNAQQGVVTVGSDGSYIGLKLLGNLGFGFDEALTAANNMLVACEFAGNILGATSLNATGDSEMIGCKGVPTALVLGRPASNWVNRWKMEGRSTGGGPRLFPDGTDTNIPIAFSTKGSGLYQFFTAAFTNEAMRLGAPVGGNTAMLVQVNKSGAFSLKQVSFGADDSGGTGFAVLRVPN